MRRLFSLPLAQGLQHSLAHCPGAERQQPFLLCGTGHPNTSREDTPRRSGLGKWRRGAVADMTLGLSPDRSIWHRHLFQAVAEMQPLGQDYMFLMQPQAFPERSVSATAHCPYSFPKTSTLVLSSEWEHRLCLLIASTEIWATTVTKGDTRLFSFWLTVWPQETPLASLNLTLLEVSHRTG